MRPARAAQALGVNKSTISRWLKKNPALLDADGMVSVEELRAHRVAVIDPRLQTRGPTAAPQTPPPAAEQAAGTPTLNDHKSRYERARADEAELDLAERLGETMRRSDVEAAVAEAAETMRQTAAQICCDRADALAAIDDPRAMQAELERLFADAMRAAVAKLAAAAAAPDGTADAA